MATCANGDILTQRRLLLQKPNPASTPDANGHIDYAIDANWTNVGYAWGTPKNRGGKEAYLFDQVQSDVSSIWDFKYSGLTKQIQSTWRLKLGQRFIEIAAVFDVDEARKTIRCLCVERT